ncbi:MAG: OsmC family protein [Promethearchaeota archaeon]
MKITAKWMGGVGFQAKVRHFPEVWIDEPKEFHGDDRGISSVEYLMVGIAGCLGSSITYCFRNMDIAVSDIDIEVEAKLHHPEPGHPLRIVKLTAKLDVKLEPDQDEELVALCHEKFKKYCVVTQSVIQGIPAIVDVDIHQ